MSTQDADGQGGPTDDATGVEVEQDGEIESQPLPVQTCMILAVPV